MALRLIPVILLCFCGQLLSAASLEERLDQLDSLVDRGSKEQVDSIARLLLNEASATGRFEEQARAASILGDLYVYLDADSAREYYLTSNRIYDSLGLFDESLDARLGYLESIRRLNPNKTMKEYAALLLDEQMTGDSVNYFKVIRSLSTLHYGMRDFRKAIAYLEDYIQFYASRGDKEKHGQAMQGLANFYWSISRDTARMYYEQAIPLLSEVGSYRSLVYSYQSCGALLRESDSATSWRYLYLADSFDRAHDIRSPQLALITAKSYNLIGQPEKAIPLALETYNMTDQNKMLFLRFDAAQSLSGYFKQLGQYDSAFFFMEEYALLKDSIRGQRQYQELGRMESRLTYEKQIVEQEAKLESQRLRQIGFSVLLGFLLLVAGLISWFYLRIRKINLQIEKQNVELDRMDKLNKKVFSVISHDLKGPLLSMRLLLDSLQKGRADQEQTELYTADLQQQLLQSENILQNLLNWARNELGLSKAITTENCLAQTVADKVIVQLEPSTKAKQIRILNLFPDDYRVPMTADIFTIVLRNLLSNAIKYSNPGSDVQCGLDEDSGSVFVRDFGLGIPADVQEKLFSSNVDSQPGTDFETGFGLGLHITAELVRQSGGSIRVESNPGQTTFLISF